MHANSINIQTIKCRLTKARTKLRHIVAESRGKPKQEAQVEDPYAELLGYLRKGLPFYLFAQDQGNKVATLNAMGLTRDRWKAADSEATEEELQQRSMAFRRQAVLAEYGKLSSKEADFWVKKTNEFKIPSDVERPLLAEASISLLSDICTMITNHKTNIHHIQLICSADTFKVSKIVMYVFFLNHAELLTILWCRGEFGYRKDLEEFLADESKKGPYLSRYREFVVRPFGGLH
ncbi:hypothetical protein FRC02_011840 [Tulasnella sp. 418]|nr:hypothetical protein FRC02_011840 [Tulasnella sp. 418]